MAEIGEGGKEITCGTDPGFVDWMSRIGGSIVISTYQAGKLAIVGWNGQQVGITMRHFRRPMGMAVTGGPVRDTRVISPFGTQPAASPNATHAHEPRQIALATQFELLHFSDANLLAPDYLNRGRYDALFIPRASYLTGHLNLHDMAFGDDGLVIVNTRFSCLCKVGPQYSFTPIWQPPFITMLEPFDRCHLNGLAMERGRPRYVTALGKSDKARGWHADRMTSGILMDVPSGEVLKSDLSMPHSPRLHAGKLWLLNSAQGELCQVDLKTGSHEVVAVMPGFLRGLTFVEGYDGRTYALIGLSRVREKYLFEGLPIGKRFPKLVCGAAVVDVAAGRVVGIFEFLTGAEELYDVQFLHGVLKPAVLSRDKEAVVEAVTAPEFSYWLRNDAGGKADQDGSAAPPALAAPADATGTAAGPTEQLTIE